MPAETGSRPGGSGALRNTLPSPSPAPCPTPQVNLSVGVAILGLIMNSCIIGSVASILAAADSQTSQRKQRLDAMQRFMIENKVKF